jgi:PAS domain S-box-containing protein
MKRFRGKLVSVFLLTALPFALFAAYQWNASVALLRNYSILDESARNLITELTALDQALSGLDSNSGLSAVDGIKHPDQALRAKLSERRHLISTMYLDHGTLTTQLLSVRQGLEKGFVWALLISVGLALLFSHLLTRSMQFQLHQLERRIERMTAGDFFVNSSSPGGQYVDSVLEALRRLSGALEERVVHRRDFQDILDSMHEGVLVTDLVGFVTYANIRARDLLNAPHKEILGEHIATLVTGRWELDGSSGRSRREARLQGAEGDFREVVIERSSLTDQNGLLRGMLFVVEDVTERNRLARDLTDQRDMLARSERLSALGTLGAIVAHKLSQPISSVRLFLQQVKREIELTPTSQLVRDNLDDSLAELDRIAGITKQMLHTGRGQLSGLSGHLGGTPVLSAAMKIKEALQDTARRRGVALSIRSESSDLRVACSAVELEEILYCLVTNSLQAAREGDAARVDVDIERTGDAALITVTDTCEGISLDHIDRIFDCFFTTKPEGQGTGLGLAIVRHIAERYGGKVEVSSEEGMGSCFMISLPLSKEVGSGYDPESVRC